MSEEELTEEQGDRSMSSEVRTAATADPREVATAPIDEDVDVFGHQDGVDSGNSSSRTPHSSQRSQPVSQSSYMSRTPVEIMGTPRTPRHTGTVPFGARGATPLNNAIPRGDMGRGTRVPAFHQGGAGGGPGAGAGAGAGRGGGDAPPTPSTPMGFDFGLQSQNSPPGGNYYDQGGSPMHGDRGQNEDEEPLADMRIWGTTINVQQCASAFKTFMEEFTVSGVFEPHYMHQLEVLRRVNKTVFNLNCTHLYEFHATKVLYQQLVEFPQEVIPVLDLVINEKANAEYGRHADAENFRPIQVRTFNLRTSHRMRELDPMHIDQLLSIKGMVIRCSPIIPDLKLAFFRCSVCKHNTEVMINQGKIDEPTKCNGCNMTGSMELIHNRCSFTDKQLIRLQEVSDEVPEGETPYTVTLFAFDDLVDSVRPGDRLEVTGVFRAVPRRVDPKRRTVRSIYKTYVDTIHFRRSDMDDDEMHQIGNPADRQGNTQGGKDNLEKNESTTFPTERVEEFKAFAKEGRCYERLVASFAPSIWELEDVKKGVLCLLLGGSGGNPNRSEGESTVPVPGPNADDAEPVPWEADAAVGNENDSLTGQSNIALVAGANDRLKRDRASKSHKRSDINILLCGDPGTSKSQLLAYAHKLSPRGIYTSGKGSSAVGLTASVIRDPETRDMVLESGALVLSDNGICCIDEFDKMSESTRAILHEAMEQQTVSITKAGIIATLNARTSILASANPVESRYNSRMSVVENIKLPPTLLSRFDLIYLILDKPNAEQDRRLAKHLVSLYYSDDVVREQKRGAVDQGFLRDYLIYARATVQPEVSEEAVEVLVQGYLSMRSMGGRGSKTITATPRQLESLIRISQSLAKMRLDVLVTAADVREAIRLMQVATQTAATDPRTGTINMDLINTGRTSLDRELIAKLGDEIKHFLQSHKGSRMTVGQVRLALMQQQQQAGINMPISLLEVEEAVRDLETDGVLQLLERTMTIVVR